MLTELLRFNANRHNRAVRNVRHAGTVDAGRYFAGALGGNDNFVLSGSYLQRWPMLCAALEQLLRTNTRVFLLNGSANFVPFARRYFPALAGRIAEGGGAQQAGLLVYPMTGTGSVRALLDDLDRAEDYALVLNDVPVRESAEGLVDLIAGSLQVPGLAVGISTEDFQLWRAGAGKQGEKLYDGYQVYVLFRPLRGGQGDTRQKLLDHIGSTVTYRDVNEGSHAEGHEHLLFPLPRPTVRMANTALQQRSRLSAADRDIRGSMALLYGHNGDQVLLTNRIRCGGLTLYPGSGAPRRDRPGENAGNSENED